MAMTEAGKNRIMIFGPKGGGMCVTHTDLNRGYGYQAACPAPKAAAAPKRTARR